MVDAAGAIYVIGGTGVSSDFQDVWVSTDGGVRAGLGQRGVCRRVLKGGTQGVTKGVLQGTMGY